MGEVTYKRLFHSLAQQLKYEIFFVSEVGTPYYDASNELETLDFNYKGRKCQLVLNGTIELKTQQFNQEIISYQELVDGLIRFTQKPHVQS